MSARDLKLLLPGAREAVQREIAGNASHGKYGAVLSTEGYAGSYRAALDDVDAVLRTIPPVDHRNYWREARQALSAKAKGPTP